MPGMALVLVAVAVAVVLLATLALRHNEVFYVSIRDRRLLVIRGGLPVRLRQDFADVVAEAGLRRASVRALRAETHTRLEIEGADEATAQRLRNVFGIHPSSRLRAPAPHGERRNLGQLLGWAWLAWALLPRRR